MTTTTDVRTDLNQGVWWKGADGLIRAGTVARTWHESHIGNSGSRTGLPCPMPKCSGEIVYNGNYFCTNWGHVYQGERRGGPCDWALSHGDDGEPVGRRDKRVWREIQETTFFKDAETARLSRG